MESSEPEYKSVEDFLKRASRRQKRMRTCELRRRVKTSGRFQTS
jgi:hypothetical protein